MAEKLSQRDLILAYMEKNGSITPKDAYREFGCLRLAAQIFNLKSEGIAISTTRETVKNKYGNTTCYARYSLCN